MISESDILNASILIVDDQEVNVSLLEQLLRDAGYFPSLRRRILTRSASCTASTVTP
jgi:CheY-like chemotaxis protein